MHYLTKSCSQLILTVSIITIHYVPGAAEGLEPDNYHCIGCGNPTRKFGETYGVQRAYDDYKLISLYEGLVVDAWTTCDSSCSSTTLVRFYPPYGSPSSHYFLSNQKLRFKVRNGTIFYVSLSTNFSMKVYDPRLNISDPDHYIGFGSVTTTMTSGYKPEGNSGVPAAIIGCIVAIFSITLIVVVAIKGCKIYSENCGGDVFSNSNDDANETSGPPSAPPPEYTELMLSNTAASVNDNSPSKNKYTTVVPLPSYNEAIAMETV